MITTAVECVIRAPRATVYRTLLDPNLVQSWRVPDGMTGTIHRFEPFEGGRIRISLTYEDPARQGKSGAHNDTYCGRFTKLVPDELIIEVDEFETSDPALCGETISVIELSDHECGTKLSARHRQLPPGLSPDDNQLGWQLALEKLRRILQPGGISRI